MRVIAYSSHPTLIPPLTLTTVLREANVMRIREASKGPKTKDEMTPNITRSHLGVPSGIVVTKMGPGGMGGGRSVGAGRT
jgi:hypothetical protein